MATHLQEIPIYAEVAEPRRRTVDFDAPFLPERISSGQNVLKRLIDLAGSIVGLILLGAMLPYLAYRIKKESPGPIFYKQPRTGKDAKVFYCYKFRSMHINDDSNRNGKPVVTQVGDSRIFPFGQFMRNSNLDELPQLLNVFKGEMSLVGPRPYPVAECQYWTGEIKNWKVRYHFKPGITGWAQVTGFRGGTLDVEHMKQRLRRDFVYIESASLWLDMLILYKTVKQMVVGRTGAH
jgi:putative colanic acid biosysnthesis UDP-glucose lipid carrier transferase